MIKQITLFIILTFAGVGLASGQDGSAQQSQTGSEDLPPVAYGELIGKASQYNHGQVVRVRALNYIGFEEYSLGDPDHPEVPKAWLEAADEKDRCPEWKETVRTSSNKRVRANPRGGAVEVIVTGQLFDSGRYGHLGLYPYKFVATCLADSTTDKPSTEFPSPLQIIQREGRFVLTDDSSYYLFKKDGTFKSGPLGLSGREISGGWKLRNGLFVIDGKWGWLNGASQNDDYRQMILQIGKPFLTEMMVIQAPSEFGASAVKIYKCYFEIEELKKNSK